MGFSILLRLLYTNVSGLKWVLRLSLVGEIDVCR